jgi:CHAD domain-containing protein
MSVDRRGSIPEAMDQFASIQVNRLLGKLVFQVRHAARRPDEETIHDLRVSIRRLSQCLREFRQFFPHRETKKILKQLGKVMDQAAEMRNRDVAIELMGGPEGAAHPELVANLQREREQAKRKLARTLAQWRRSDFSRKWRPWLAA